ncbi:Signal recognition particle 19 kDa protein [Cryptosporidium felis]|nr:Signal recognition particle 19 kDa protein [Cryptosporidium felis]
MALLDQDITRWKVIYPAYLNKERTISQGRIASSINCVDCPTVAEIAEVCIQLGIPCKIESNRYPKDFQSLGRVRYQIFDKNGNAYNENILSKKLLLNYIGSHIPKLKSRQMKTLSTTDSQSTKDSKTNNSGYQSMNKNSRDLTNKDTSVIKSDNVSVNCKAQKKKDLK